MMEINRNQWFMAGLVIVALGIQFRLVDKFVLNEPTTKFIRERFAKKESIANASPFQFLASTGPMAKHPVKPPKWLGWALLSVGGVLVLHSLAMKKPE